MEIGLGSQNWMEHCTLGLSRVFRGSGWNAAKGLDDISLFILFISYIGAIQHTATHNCKVMLLVRPSTGLIKCRTHLFPYVGWNIFAMIFFSTTSETFTW